jgi:ribosomal protein S18 acetylase RimI-like enzyme
MRLFPAIWIRAIKKARRTRRVDGLARSIISGIPYHRVIQGSFPSGTPRIAAPASHPFASQAVQQKTAHAPGNANAWQLPPHVAAFPSHGGQPLPAPVRQRMEAAFGADFRDVRVHVTPQTRTLGATALTYGANIHFAPGHYAPHTHQGLQLLGRELAHVVQQRAGRVRNPFPTGVALVHDRMLEAEAERLGRCVVQTPPRPSAAQAKLAPRVAQRQAAIHVSAPVRIGKNAYRIAAQDAGRQVGSVTVRTRGNAIEITDLGVEASRRQEGIGGTLMSSAMNAARSMGKTHVVLSSQDDGSGNLTRWYKSMGFAEVGRDARGMARLAAAVGTVRPVVAQRLAAPHALVIQRAASSSSSSSSGTSGAMDLSDDDLMSSVVKRIAVELNQTRPGWGGTGTALDMRHEYERCSSSTKAAVNVIGATHGCHTCGTIVATDADQAWIGDHIPPTGLRGSVCAALGFVGSARTLYPHCDACSEKQSALVNALNAGTKTVAALTTAERNLVTAGLGTNGVASSGSVVTASEGQAIQAIGIADGCHSCGGRTVKDKYHADHCPPKEFYTKYMTDLLGVLGITLPAWVAKPQCPRCSNGQGGAMTALVRDAKQLARSFGITVYS